MRSQRKQFMIYLVASWLYVSIGLRDVSARVKFTTARRLPCARVETQGYGAVHTSFVFLLSTPAPVCAYFHIPAVSPYSTIVAAF